MPRAAVQPSLSGLEEETPGYLEKDLITYIGNKRTLLPFIQNGIELVQRKLRKSKLDFLDLFAGSGVVSRLMKRTAKRLAVNDLENYAGIVNACYLANRSALNSKIYWEAKSFLEEKITSDWRRGFIAEMYAPENDANIKPGERVFFTRRNAEYIDTARQHIDLLPEELRGWFLAPLIVKASVHNNTGGVFKGFYKNREGIGAFGGEGANALTRILAPIALEEPRLSQFECDVRILSRDACEFAAHSDETFDLVYMDPPYNQHPYGSNYFMLNLIASYERPSRISSVSGIPDDWSRSPFNKPRHAKAALFRIIDELNARFFLISYNSEGFIGKDEFLTGLKQRGELHVLETKYNTYRASRNLSGRDTYVTEYLFLLRK